MYIFSTLHILDKSIINLKKDYLMFADDRINENILSVINCHLYELKIFSSKLHYA